MVRKATVGSRGSKFLGETENAESCHFCLICESVSSQFFKLTRSKNQIQYDVYTHMDNSDGCFSQSQGKCYYKYQARLLLCLHLVNVLDMEKCLKSGKKV